MMLNIGLFRGIALVVAFVLGCQAIWILAAEFIRPKHFRFPVDAQTAEVAANNRNTAGLAASFGIMRGDLWADYAFTYLDLFWSDRQTSSKEQNSRTIERARDTAVRALTLAPHDARVWATLASINWRFNWLNRKATALQMSYFTGANETELIPLRLLMAVQSEAIADKDFQQLVRHDVGTIVSRKPELKSAILTAYRDALPDGKKFIEETLQELDPALLAQVQKIR
jgi:hypothetical protein